MLGKAASEHVISCDGATNTFKYAIAIRTGSLPNLNLLKFLVDGVEYDSNSPLPAYLQETELVNPHGVDDGWTWRTPLLQLKNNDSYDHRVSFYNTDPNVKIYLYDNPTIVDAGNGNSGACLSKAIHLNEPLILEVFHTQNAKLTLTSVMDGSVLIDWGDGNLIDITEYSGSIPTLSFYSEDLSSSPIVKDPEANWSVIKLYGEFLGSNDSAHVLNICGSALRRVIDWGDGMGLVKRISFAPIVNFASHSLISVPNYLPRNISSFDHMFKDCVNLNCNLDEWDISKSIEFQGMFSGCTTFNGNIKSWTPKNVPALNVNDMFNYCSYFSQDLSSWNLSNVTKPSTFAYNAPNFDESKYPKFANS